MTNHATATLAGRRSVPGALESVMVTVLVPGNATALSTYTRSMWFCRVAKTMDDEVREAPGTLTVAARDG